MNPIKVDPNKLQAVAVTLALAIIGIIGGATTLIGLLKAHDMAGVYNWLQSTPAATFFAGVATVLSLGGLGARTVVRKLREVYLAWHAPNAIVTGAAIPTPAPPPAGVVELITGQRANTGA